METSSSTAQSSAGVCEAVAGVDQDRSRTHFARRRLGGMAVDLPAARLGGVRSDAAQAMAALAAELRADEGGRNASSVRFGRARGDERAHDEAVRFVRRQLERVHERPSKWAIT